MILDLTPEARHAVEDIIGLEQTAACTHAYDNIREHLKGQLCTAECCTLCLLLEKHYRWAEAMSRNTNFSSKIREYHHDRATQLMSAWRRIVELDAYGDVSPVPSREAMHPIHNTFTEVL